VALDKASVAALRAHRKRQNEERLAWGEAWQNSGGVFTREDGAALRGGHEAAEAIAALVPRKIAVGEASETAGPPSVSPVNFPVPTDSPKKRTPRSLGVRGEPTRGIEPLTYGLQVGRGMSIDVSRGP
jgi:hypothetical protein